MVISLAKKVIVISDTHDNLNALEKLVSTVNISEVDTVIHCGDIVSPFTLGKLLNVFPENIRIFAVLGNNEGEIFKIVEDYKELNRANFRLEKMSMETFINGYKTLIIHGWGTPDNLRGIIHHIGRGGDYKVILYGHIHVPELTMVRYGGGLLTKHFGSLDRAIERVVPLDEIKTVIINPGELGGWLSGEQTYVILEFMGNKKLKILMKKI